MDSLTFNPRALVDRLDRARETGEFTDFTFACNGRNIQVHKVIICTQSPVFRAACAGPFKEAISGTYDLTSHQPDMIQLMVDYLYTGDYSVDDNKADDERTTYHSSDLSTHAIMYALGDEYDIEGLRDLSAKKYSLSLERDINIDDFLLSIPYVYSLTLETSRDLRDPALEFARTQLRTTQTDVRDAFDDLVLECPEFLKELLYYCIQSPFLGYCPCTGPMDKVPIEAQGYRCKGCGRCGASLMRPV
ncbi:Kelch-like protein 21 [Fusarium austroafricanum]|uniref:Kelch-like protein 21 n=1 Tax=Fusarium austroafricanum TaxID=2364996 RepID=A0A8H4NLB2_9HYPO|nr:Kelch-like protein 21 [Fusarium austroafricanum]